MNKQPVSYEEFVANHKKLRSPEETQARRKNCCVTPVLAMLQGKWKTYVLFELCKWDCIRFSALKKSLPEITNTMLTATLRELEQDGLVERIQYNEIPPHVEYLLTQKGRDLLPVFYEIYKYGVQYSDESHT